MVKIENRMVTVKNLFNVVSYLCTAVYSTTLFQLQMVGFIVWDSLCRLMFCWKWNCQSLWCVCAFDCSGRTKWLIDYTFGIFENFLHRKNGGTLYEGHSEIIDNPPPSRTENERFIHQLEIELSWGIHFGGWIRFQTASTKTGRTEKSNVW